MKKILLILIFLTVLAVGGVAAYLYMNADALIARLRPELEKIASDVMKTPVKLGELHLGIGLKPEVRIDGVSLGDAQTAEALKVKSVLLSLDLMPLLSKELKITELKVEQPQITAIKTDQGVKIIGLPEKAPATESTPAPAASGSGPGKAAAPALPLSFALENFSLADGEITFEDKTKPPGPLSRFEIRKIDVSSSLAVVDNVVKLNKASITTVINQVLPVDITVASVALNLGTMDATLEQIAINFLDSQLMLNSALNLTSMRGKAMLNSQGISLAKLSPLDAFVPALKQFPLSGSVAPDITLTLEGATAWSIAGNVALKEIGTTVNNFKLSSLNGAIDLSANPLEQKAGAKNLTLSFQGAPISLDFAALLKDMKASLSSFELRAFSGTISGNAGTTLTAPQRYSSDIKVAGLDISQALGALSGTGSSPLSGIIESVSVALTGELGERLKETTGGNISFKIRDTLLKQVNVAHEAFKGLLTLPLIGERISRAIAPQFREELLAQDTRIRSISGTLNGSNGVFALNNLLLLGSFFSVEGQGSVSLSADVDLTTKIAFNRDFSASLVNQVKELRPALDLKGELTFPLAISGRAPALRIVPDTKGLLKLGAEAAVREGAERLLERALKNKTGGGGDTVKGLGGLLGF